MRRNPPHRGLIASILFATLVVLSTIAAGQEATPPPLPPPGRLVDVGGWRLHLNCSGKTTPNHPIVILEAGIGDFSVERIYRAIYPSDVAGMVLVEGGADNPWRMTAGGKLVRSKDLATERLLPAVQTSTPLRISDIPPQALSQMKVGLDEASRRANEPPRDKLPPDAQRMRTWALGQVAHVAAGVNPFVEEELAVLRAESAKGAGAYGDMPLVVITRGKSEDDGPDGRAFAADRKKDNAAMALLSRNGKHVIAERSGHHVQIEEPELVVTAIEQVVATAKK